MDNSLPSQKQNLNNQILDAYSSQNERQSSQLNFQKNKINVWLISLLISLFGGMSFLGFEYYQLKRELNNQKTVVLSQENSKSDNKQQDSSSVNITETGDHEASNWKTYIHPNSEYLQDFFCVLPKSVLPKVRQKLSARNLHRPHDKNRNASIYFQNIFQNYFVQKEKYLTKQIIM